MSIMDALAMFSDQQALLGTADSENILDMGAGVDRWGVARVAPELADGKPLYLNICCPVALDSAGEAATLTVALSSCATVGGSYVAAWTSAAIAEAALVAGHIIAAIPIPAGLSRFWKLTYTVGTENFTSGKVSAWVGFEPLRSPAM